MQRVAAVGEEERVAGFALAGATVHVAPTADAVRAAWRELGPDVGLVILTPAAARALATELAAPSARRLWAVMPP